MTMRKQHKPEFKARVALEAPLRLSPLKPPRLALPIPASRHQISPSTTVRAARGDGAVGTSLLSCRKAEKPRISKPVWESSGESQVNLVITG